MIGDSGRRADEGVPAIAAETLGDLADGQMLPLCQLDDPLASALAGVGLGDLGQRTVRIEARGIVAERDRERGDRVGVVHAAVDERPLLARLLDAVADHDQGARKDLQMLGIAAGFFHAAFHVRVESLGVGDMRPGSEHDLRRLGRKLATGVGSAGLDDDGPALHRTSDIEGAAHREVFSLVVQHVQLVGVEIDAAVDVAHEGIVGKTVP